MIAQADRTSSIKITPDGNITEVSLNQEEEETAYRTQYCWSLAVPEHWEHKKFRLAMLMFDTLNERRRLEQNCNDVVQKATIPSSRT